MVESCVLLVLEMKKDDVEKTLAIFSRLIDEKKIEGESLSKGLNDPLEFLSDIAIDAPLASDHLANIVSSFVKSGAVSLDFLLSAPDYFRTDGKAAQFAAKVIKKMGADDDAASFAAGPAGLRWRGRRIGAGTLRAVRHELFPGYGSCSFDEPVQDLIQMGLLQPDGVPPGGA